MTSPCVTSPTAEDERAIMALFECLRRAHRDKDAMAIAACYTPTAVVCDLAPPLSHCGIDLVEKQSWLDSWDGPITLEPRGGSLTVDSGLAVYHGYTRMSGTKRPASMPVSFWKRDTFCLKRDEAGWRIAHHHTSVPLYMDGSLRPAFDLTP
jgi:ketosteroid isomerase-like protein